MTEPVITLQHFFERAREGELTGIKCGGCGELAIPPREFCASCHQRAWTPMPLSGHGKIASFTVIRVAPRAHAGDAPYGIAAVQLAEGVSLLGRIVDIPLEKLAIGLPVRFRPLLRDGQTAISFGPA
ncbi:MAG TPA: Zn-ribbon domain-containing OB-fold protein [Methylomirabilota bacterium]|nr:Zn-ribbon domain-containing OB-fold protein [Methylomirabilota bacterium]HEV8614530.1 Zn-ribbon domain-containing OB-fold protein [Methylomirabilota bacterium]